MDNPGTIDIEQLRQELRNEQAELDKRAGRENARMETHQKLRQSLELLSGQIKGDSAKEVQNKIYAMQSEIEAGADVCEQYTKEFKMVDDKKRRMENALNAIRTENDRVTQLINRISSSIVNDKKNENMDI